MEFLLDGGQEAIRLLVNGDPETYSAIRATVAVSSLSVLASLALGIPLGFGLGYADFPGRRALRTMADTALALPTVVIGLVVYALLSKQGPLGHLGLLFTLPGIAIGLTILGVPIIVSLTATAVEGLDEDFRHTVLTLGANRRQMLLAGLWEARYSMMVAAVLAFGRIVSEVGIAMMVGGNIKWHTRTITTAIALETGKGEFATGIALGIVLLGIALAVNSGIVLLRKRARL